MNKKTQQFLSILFLFISLLLEGSEQRGIIAFKNPETLFGISLALVLISMSINVKIIRTMGIDIQTRRTSQMALIIAAVYATLVFGLEYI